MEDAPAGSRGIKAIFWQAYRRLLGSVAKPLAVGLAISALVTVLVRITDLFVPRKEQKYRVTGRDLMRILRDRKDGVCISDIESALIGRIVTCRVKGRFVMVEDLLDAVRDAD